MKFSASKIMALGLLFLGIGMVAPESAFAQKCEAAFSFTPQAENLFHQKAYREQALQIMLEGSLNVSRTKASGRRFMAPEDVADNQIAVLAEANFRKAANYVLLNFEHLEINLKTATVLNKILTEGLVPQEVRGQFNYRPLGPYAHQLGPEIGTLPKDFYVTWLSSPQAKALYEVDPIAFAEVVHNAVVSLDSFPDGNGRLSRLFADLVLIKSGQAPAFYTSMKDYFDRGNARAPVSREVRQQYFREIVEKGRKALHPDLGFIPSVIQLNLAFAA